MVCLALYAALALWLIFLPLYAHVFLRARANGNAIRHALLPHIRTAIGVQVAIAVGIVWFYRVVTPVRWDRDVFGLVAISLPPAAIVFTLFVNALISRKLTSLLRYGDKIVFHPQDLVVVGGVAVAAGYIRAAAPQSPWGNSELFAMWGLLEVLAVSNALLVWTTSAGMGTRHVPQRVAISRGMMRTLATGAALLWVFACACIPSF